MANDYIEQERLPSKDIEAWTSLIIPSQKTSLSKYLDAHGVLKSRYLKYKEMFKSDLMKAWLDKRDSELIEYGITVARMIQQLDMTIEQTKKPVFMSYDRAQILTDFSDWAEKADIDGKKMNDETREGIVELFSLWINDFEQKTVENSIVDLSPSVSFVVDEFYDLAIISAGRGGNAAKNVRTERAIAESFKTEKNITDEAEAQKKPGLFDKVLGIKPKKKMEV